MRTKKHYIKDVTQILDYDNFLTLCKTARSDIPTATPQPLQIEVCVKGGEPACCRKTDNEPCHILTFLQKKKFNIFYF